MSRVGTLPYIDEVEDTDAMVNPPQPPFDTGSDPAGPYQYPLGPQLPFAPRGPVDAQQSYLAPWWKRVVAYLIDSIILGIPLGIIGIVVLGGVHQTCVVQIGSLQNTLSSNVCTPTVPVVRLGVFSLITLVASLAYFGTLDGSARGQTLGKMALNIATRDAATGFAIGPPRATLRMFIMDILGIPFLLFIPLLLDVLWPLWDPRRQCWHDKAVGSVVVDLAGSPPVGTSPALTSAVGSSASGKAADMSARLLRDLPRLIVALATLAVAIVVMVILVGKAEHIATQPAQQTIVSMPHAIVPTAPALSPGSEATLPANKPRLGRSLSDNFAASKSLAPSEWITSSSMLSSMAAVGNEMLVGPALGFTSAGMTMEGVSGPEQFAGIQSVKLFAPPFTVVGRVIGNISSGNPFGLFLINQEMTQYIDVAGNLNPANGVYGIRLDTEHGPAGYLGSDVLVAAPHVGTPYVLSIEVDSAGIADAKVEDSAGHVLGSAAGISVGRGPFYVVLAQWEGTPVTEGPNQATWTSLDLHHS